MKGIIKKVLDKYADRQINLASEAAREELAEAIYREVGNFLQWWGKKPDIRYEMPDNYGVDQGGAYRIVDDAGVDVDSGKYVGDNGTR
tara:strand:+ start:116 stop:379 length:264 start_codon:yes stop_codon:yes gene_type:complete